MQPFRTRRSPGHRTLCSPFRTPRRPNAFAAEHAPVVIGKRDRQLDGTMAQAKKRMAKFVTAMFRWRPARIATTPNASGVRLWLARPPYDGGELGRAALTACGSGARIAKNRCGHCARPSSLRIVTELIDPCGWNRELSRFRVPDAAAAKRNAGASRSESSADDRAGAPGADTHGRRNGI